MWLVKVFCVLCVLFNGIQSAKILCIFPSPSPSHSIVAEGILIELARDGHEVTMISFVPLGKSIENYRDIVIPKSESYRQYQEFLSGILVKSKLALLGHFNKMPKIIYKLADDILMSEVFQKILAEETFDLLILGPMMTFLVGYGAHFNCPIIMFSMVGTMNQLNSIIGNPTEISYVPQLWSGVKGVMNFKQRLLNIFYAVFEILSMGYLGKFDRISYEKYFGHLENFPTYDQQKRNISLIFINDHFTQTGSRPLITNMIEIGGIQVKETPDPLPDDIQKWMDSNPYGVIYFSLGSNIKSASLSPEKLGSILKTFGKLKQNVLWKFENDQIDGLPKNVMIKKWLPQDDLLTHPNVKLFITHGGLGSVVESKYHAVPLVLIPLFADQIPNADKVLTEGWGIKLEFADLTEDSLTNAITEVLQNPIYKKIVQKWSNEYRDRPHTARQAVVYWTNYVLRYHGAPHLQSHAKELNFFERHSFDTFGFIFVVLIGVLYFQYRIVKYFLKYLCRKLSNNKNKID